jgi:ATP-dependent Clp protease protease subunit
MIHNCWVMAIGNRHDMAETATWLEPFDQAMRDVYARAPGDRRRSRKWMDAETYMSGSTAIERGFADALLRATRSPVDDKTKAERPRRQRAARAGAHAGGTAG